MALSTLFVWLPPLLLACLLSLLFASKTKKTRLPPGPPELPILGNLHQLGELAHQSLWQLSKKYGPIMHLQLGRVPTLVVSSAETAREILKTHDLEFCNRHPLLGPKRLSYNLLDVAFGSYNEYWREMRKIVILEIFSTKRVQSFRFVREEEVASMISTISQNSLSDPISLSEKLFTLTTNIILRNVVGKTYKESEREKRRVEELLKEGMDALGIFSIADFYPSYGIGWILDVLIGVHARLEKSFFDLNAFYQQVIDDHLDPKRVKLEQEDIIDVLLRLQSNQLGANGIQLNQDHIKGLLMNLLLAGGDTSAETMVWGMAELARNPRVMKKVQDEVRSFVGSKGKVEESDIDHLKYLKMVMKETLRLHPVAPLLLPRQTIRNCKINGYDIRPKTRVQVNVWAIGRDPKSWQNPEEFYPERSMDSSISYKGQHFKLLPFGAGRRICPGVCLGIQIMELALANLLYCFDWELPSGMKKEDVDMAEAPGLAVHKKTVLKLVPINYDYSQV